jgi:hypothetical protein
LKRKIITILLIVASIATRANAQVVDAKELKSNWLVYSEDKYIPYNNQPSRTIFFWIDTKLNKHQQLLIDARHNYSLFINNKLVVQKKGKSVLSIDSLSKHYPFHFFVSIYSATGVHHVSTRITMPANELNPMKRKGNFFLDFSLLATLALIGSFAIFIQTNPALTFDYLNVRKWFSFQEKDESKFTLRIASSVNLLFYLFGSFFMSLMLIIAFHFAGDQFWLAQAFPIKSTPQAFWQWLLLSAVIFGCFIIKLAWLAMLAALFGFRDTVNFQFFNFMRSILIAITTVAFLCLVYYILGIQSSSYFEYLIFILSAIFVVGIALIYFKLLSRMPFHFFHLFSYLCASEIIPTLVLIRFFFY